MKKKTLYENLLIACKHQDYALTRSLMEGYSSAKMRTAYKVIETMLGYDAYCRAKRGEKVALSDFLGI